MKPAPKSKRPYLLRAFYEWIVDSDLTPYLVVAVNSEQVVVPPEFVNEGRIVLNVSPLAVRNLVLGNDAITFDGRFSGKPFFVSAPVASVLTIYARESGEGMMFDEVEPGPESRTSEAPDLSGDDTPGGRPARPGDHLKVVK